MIRVLQGATKVTIGDAVISTPDTTIGCETCEELFTPDPPHNAMSLNGVEIITNSSGSHWTLRKLNLRMQLITEATRKNGGVYIYANQQGCDGDRLYYDGCAMIICNGKLLAQGSQFSLEDVEVVTATIDLEEIRAYRSAPSRGMQSVLAPTYMRIETEFELSSEEEDYKLKRFPSPEIQPRYHSPEEEIALCTGAYLWDYLRRCGVAGYLVPLSGGIDSCATAVIVFSMCRMVSEACKAGNKQVIADVLRIAKYTEGEVPETPEALCNQLFHTVYMVSTAYTEVDEAWLTINRACPNKAQRRQDRERKIWLRPLVLTMSILTLMKSTMLRGTWSSNALTLSRDSRSRAALLLKTSCCRTFRR